MARGYKTLFINKASIVQRIFSAAVAADEVSEWTAKRRATAALKIDWTKPRANDGAMGIECTWPS